VLAAAELGAGQWPPSCWRRRSPSWATPAAGWWRGPRRCWPRTESAATWPAGTAPRVQHELAAALEALGDDAAAAEVAATAVDEWPPGAGEPGDRDVLEAAVIRLSRLAPQAPPGPLAGQLLAEALEGGAVTGLEARIWAAATLLDTDGQRAAALALVATAMADGVCIDLHLTRDLNVGPEEVMARSRWSRRIFEGNQQCEVLLLRLRHLRLPTVPARERCSRWSTGFWLASPACTRPRGRSRSRLSPASPRWCSRCW
jgi:hypothetical protein